MNVTLAEFAVVTATGIAAGWLWCSDEAAVLRWFRRQADWFVGQRIRSSKRSRPLWSWVDDLQNCPLCLGFWVQLAAVAAVAGLDRWTLPLALSALVVHLAWQRIVALISAVILR